MSCGFGVKWCKGPAGFGAKCQSCQKGLSQHPGGPPVQAKAVQPTPLKIVSPAPLGVFKPAIVDLAALAKPPTPVPDPSSGALVLYRGDTREPAAIKRDGFQHWGEAIANVSKAKGIGYYLADVCVTSKNGRTFADWVRGSKNRGRPTISTAKNDGCGGYGSDYVYRIEFPGLMPQRFGAELMPAERIAAVRAAWDPGLLVSYTDNPTFAGCKFVVIDLKLGTEEHAVFTQIHSKYITAWGHGSKRDADTRIIWNSMADVTAEAHRKFF